MKFCWCTIMVKDLENSLSFYRDIVGLPVSRRFSGGPGMELCFLGEGETKVELICDRNCKDPGTDESVSLGFEVKSLAEKLAFIEQKGLKVHAGPFQPNPHVKFFFVKDPDGVRVQFVENL